MRKKAKIENIFFKKDGVIVNFQFDTKNSKTGGLIQNYFLPEAWISSDKKLKDLDDRSICFDCDHGKTKNGTCYVPKGTSGMGLASKVRSLRLKGLDNIPELSPELEADLLDAISGRGIRFGSYGEPVLLGEELVKKISDRADFWTGYTHQWHKNPWAKKYFMASVETTLVDKAAQSMGWRTFYAGEPTEGNHVTCPASKEAGYKTTCDNCKLCMGTTSKAKSVKIKIH
jgi:hypothetical protein